MWLWLTALLMDVAVIGASLGIAISAASPNATRLLAAAVGAGFLARLLDRVAEEWPS